MFELSILHTSSTSILGHEVLSMQPPNFLAIHPLRYASHSLLDFKVIGAVWQVLRIHESLTHSHYLPLSSKLQVKIDRDTEQAALSTQLNALLVHLGSFGKIF